LPVFVFEKAMDIESFIETRIEMMLEHPRNWGGPEAFELQVLLLLEIRHSLRLQRVRNMQNFLGDYSDFLRPRFPKVGNRPMSAICNDFESIAGALRGFQVYLDNHAKS
jgi:hypothetical protein